MDENSSKAERLDEYRRELAALRARLADAERRLAEAERRATQFSKQQVTLVNQVTALQARLAESEAQRAVLVAALDDARQHFDAINNIAYGRERDDSGLAKQGRDRAAAALATQPPSDLVALVKAVGAFRQHEAKCQENQDAGNLKDHVVKRLELLGEMYDALDTLFQNQPAFRALIESEGV